MAPNRITRGGATRRAPGPSQGGHLFNGRALRRLELHSRELRGALALLLALLVLAALLAGCGGSDNSGSSSAPGSTADGGREVKASGGTRGSPEQSADAGVLNTVLARQEAAVAAFSTAIPHLAPRTAKMASYFRAQEQEHADGILKVMRGGGIAAEPKRETIDPGKRKTEVDWLVFLYEVENATIEAELTAIGSLEESAPRLLLTSTVANQAQHLTLLRSALGSGPLASIPGPFENGDSEPPQ